MRKILIAVDKTKGTQAAVEKFCNIFTWCPPEAIVLLYVEKYAASFLMDEVLGEGELKAFKEALEGTEYQEALDKQAKSTLAYYQKFLTDKGLGGVKAIIKIGHPSDEILNTAKEEGVDMIVVGSRGKRFNPVMMGSVSREVVMRADLPVLVAK